MTPSVVKKKGKTFNNDYNSLQAMVGRWSDCEAALQCLRGKNANISEEVAEIRVTA